MEMAKEDWSLFSDRLLQGLLADSLSVKDRGEYVKISVECYVEGEPLSYIFRLPRTSTGHPRHLIGTFITEMTKRLQEAQKAQAENRSLKKKLSDYQQQLDSQDLLPAHLEDNEIGRASCRERV